MNKTETRYSIELHQELPESLYDLAYFLVDVQCIAACADRISSGRALPRYPSAFTSRRTTEQYRSAIVLRDIRRGTVLFDLGVSFLAALLFYYFQKHVLEPRQKTESKRTSERHSKSRFEFSGNDKKLFDGELPSGLTGNPYDDLPNILEKARRRGKIPPIPEPIRRRFRGHPDTPEDNRALRNAMERVLEEMRKKRGR